MSDPLDLVAQRFADDPFAASLGIVLDALTEQTVRLRMSLRPDLLNWFGRPHGGAIYALADAAFSVLANNGNNLSVALDCSITYHASPEPDATLIVEGETLATTARTGSYLFRVYAEAGGSHQLVATMKSVSYRTGKPLAP
jgi:acyl-CoA thioesterase